MSNKGEKVLENGSIIFNKYVLIKKIGEGGFGKVYLIEEKETKKQYAIKVLKKGKTPVKEINSFLREIEILKVLTNSGKTKTSTPWLYDSGKTIIKNEQDNNDQRYYYIMDYFPKRDLFEYLKKTKNGFEEKHTKIIFSKILKAVKSCHDSGICHLDLHLKNIIFDENYEPRIIDFSFSQEIKNADESGMFSNWEWVTKRCPELLTKKKYNGIKVDIFCLGVILFNIATCNFGFNPLFTINKNEYYFFIREGKYDKYWAEVKKELPKISEFSEEFKNLYVSMVAYDPKKRPTIDEILKSPWLEEINKLNEEDYHKLEEELIKEFLSLEKEMEEDNETLEIQKRDNNYGNKESGDECKQYFDLNLTPKYIYQKGLNAKNYIIIKGYLHPAQFMNDLLNKIYEEFMEICIIEEEKFKLKCNITFENKEEYDYDIDNEEEMEYMRKEDCIICLKLYESINGGYELHFIRKKGDVEDYYNYFYRIKEIIKKLLL